MMWAAPLIGQARLSDQVPLIAETLSSGQALWCWSLFAWGGGSNEPLRLDLLSPAFWGVVLAAVGLWLMLPRSPKLARRCGSVTALAGLGLVAAGLPPLAGYASQSVFWVLAGVTVISAAATITTANAVYAALWFALSLLGSAGLFLFQGAQFVAAGTVVVYAGAIVVLFLFVIMLAEPHGRAAYDRISWGWIPKPASTLAAAAMVVVLIFALDAARQGGWREKVAAKLAAAADSQQPPPIRDDQFCGAAVQLEGGRAVLRLVFRHNAQRSSEEENERLRGELERCLAELLTADTESIVAPSRVEIEFLEAHQDVLHASHTAQLGNHLFGRHLVSVEAAGALLLAALVGAVAIVIQSKGPSRRREGAQP